MKNKTARFLRRSLRLISQFLCKLLFYVQIHNFIKEVDSFNGWKSQFSYAKTFALVQRFCDIMYWRQQRGPWSLNNSVTFGLIAGVIFQIAHFQFRIVSIKQSAFFACSKPSSSTGRWLAKRLSTSWKIHAGISRTRKSSVFRYI